MNKIQCFQVFFYNHAGFVVHFYNGCIPFVADTCCDWSRTHAAHSVHPGAARGGVEMHGVTWVLAQTGRGRH